ncbi:MCE family protein [Aeromicrobium sp. A1-2]|uniref:MCE family protein n=1 Tax=Aeromicrobium sp. A1-2 TaxID=2107713 RepID=UPI0013C33279|nr:MCE family protein [Aeromicrobium sp. A1-2]
MAIAVGLVLLLSGCTFNGIYDLPLPGNNVADDDSFVVKVDFADVLSVVPRTAVMVADVPVGQVESVSRVGWHARLTIRIRNDVVLPDNAVAEIRQTSLLGEKFVALLPPTKPTASGAEPVSTGRLGPNDLIPMDSTGRNPEIEEVLGALSFLLSGGGIGQLQTITHELNEVMEGRTGKVRDVLEQLNTLVGALDSQRGDIVKAMESINGLSKTLIAEKETIGDALDAVGPAIDVMREQHSQLVKMLSELDKLGVVGTRVVEETKDDLLAQLRHLEPVLGTLADSGDSLVPGLVAAASYPFPIDAATTIRGDFANVVFKMQINLNPVSEGGLLPTSLDELHTVCRATPLAPICGSTTGALTQLCSVIATLPLCTDPAANIAPDDGGTTPAPSEPSTTSSSPSAPASGDTGTGTGLGTSVWQRLLDGLLGGGA